MTKLASILVSHQNAFFAQLMLKELLPELSKDPERILDRLQACLPELEEKEEEEKKEQARIFNEGLEREQARQYRKLREGPWYDERNELDFSPNG